MAGCNRMAELSAAAAGEDFYDERDYWWNLMEKSIPTHPSPSIPEVIFKNKEGTDWDYDTYGHGG